MNAFMTGSHVYGVPNADSDVDLCVILDSLDAEKLLELCDSSDGSGGGSLRFGNLNLIILGASDFEAWKEATEQLKLIKPVTREYAISVIAQLKESKGRKEPATA